jgi:hypothetical protein
MKNCSVIRQKVPDFAKFRLREEGSTVSGLERSEAGLTDIGQFCAPHTVVVLLEVNDISRAKAFLAPSLSRAKALLAPRAKAFGHSDGLPAG